MSYVVKCSTYLNPIAPFYTLDAVCSRPAHRASGARSDGAGEDDGYEIREPDTVYDSVYDA